MFKHLLSMKRIFLLILLTVFVAGCGNDTAPPEAPKVVTKKIAAKPPAPSQNTPAKAIAPAAAKAQMDTVAKRSAGAEKPAPVAAAIAATRAAAKVQMDPIAKPSAGAEMPAPVAAARAATQAAAKDKQGTALASNKPVSAIAPQARAIASEGKTAAQASKKAAASVNAEDEPEADASAPEERLKPAASDIEGGYSSAGKIDPFLPLFEEKPVVPDAEKQKKKRRMPLTPLERVDLSQLKLVGIVQAPSGNKALVEESSGKGYIIKKGTFIGIHAGRVLEILKDRVVVEEEVENVLGQYTAEKKELKLLKPPGEF